MTIFSSSISLCMAVVMGCVLVCPAVHGWQDVGVDSRRIDADFAAGDVGKAIDAELAKLNAERFSGCVLVAVDGRVVVAKSVGMVGGDDKLPLTPNALFEIASATKAFTSTAALILAEQGKLDLDASIGDYLLGVPESSRKITVRNLMSHRSGVPGDRYGVNNEGLDRAVVTMLGDGPRNEPGTLRPPVDDFGERFAGGYLDSLFVRRPAMERENVTARRSSITLATTFNQTMVARANNELYSKPVELIVEEGRDVGGFGLLANGRLQSIREEGGPNASRGVFSGSALAPAVQLANGLDTHLRFDASAYLGKERYHWTQLQAGLIYRPSAQLRLGGAYVIASQSGQPLFENDRLFSMRAFHGRFDVDFGSTRVSLLSKYDFDRRKWYDNEIGFSQVAGPVEPFVIFREFPRTISFGLRFRADEVFDRIQRRISGQPPRSTKDRP